MLGTSVGDGYTGGATPNRYVSAQVAYIYINAMPTSIQADAVVVAVLADGTRIGLT